MAKGAWVRGWGGRTGGRQFTQLPRTAYAMGFARGPRPLTVVLESPQPRVAGRLDLAAALKQSHGQAVAEGVQRDAMGKACSRRVQFCRASGWRFGCLHVVMGIGAALDILKGAGFG